MLLAAGSSQRQQPESTLILGSRISIIDCNAVLSLGLGTRAHDARPGLLGGFHGGRKSTLSANGDAKEA